MKRRIRENIRVEVYPRSPGDFGSCSIGGMLRAEEETIRDCEEIASQIRRHVDGLPSSGFDRRRGVSVVYDTRYECEHCYSEWTTAKDSPHNDGCCHRDEEVMNGQADPTPA